MIDAVARLRFRPIIAVAGHQEVVAQEAQHVLVVLEAAQLQVGQGLVGHRHAHVGEGGQLRVQGVGAGQADQPLIVRLEVLSDAFHPVAEAAASTEQAQHDDFSLWQRGG